MGNNVYGMVEDSELARDKFTTNSKKDLGKTRGDAVNALLDADIQKAKLEKITSDKDAIVSNLDVMRANAKTVEAQNAISDLKNGLLTGKFTADSFRQSMNNLIDRGIINGSDGGTISSKLDSIQNKIESDSEISKYLLDKDGNLKFGASGLGKATDIAKTKAEAAKSTYDNLYKGSSESDKQEMDRYMAQSEKIVTASVKEAQGTVKIDHSKDDHYKLDYSNMNLQGSSGIFSSPTISNSEDSLNIDFSNFSNTIENSKYTTPDITGVKTGLNLNQQQVDKQNEDIEKAKLEDDVERLMRKYDQQDSNNSGSKFKLKDDDK